MHSLSKSSSSYPCLQNSDTVLQVLSMNNFVSHFGITDLFSLLQNFLNKSFPHIRFDLGSLLTIFSLFSHRFGNRSYNPSNSAPSK